MKAKNVILYLFILLVVILLSISVYQDSYLSDPKVGEVWRWATNQSGNPFDKGRLKQFYDYKVIEIRGRYIQYMDLSDSSVESSSIKIFKFSSECIRKEDSE